jgi:peptidyl-prolyl cis-trans isomerase C
MRNIIIFTAIATLFITGAGCGKKPAGLDGKIVAKINNYELTAEDFNDEARLTLSNKLLSEDPKKAKEELLDEIITKKVLLQEAQRQNFDKDKAFMKEIERYWEQALIKLMVRKKLDELGGDVNNKKKQELFDDWLMKLKTNSDVKIYKENL